MYLRPRQSDPGLRTLKQLQIQKRIPHLGRLLEA